MKKILFVLTAIFTLSFLSAEAPIVKDIQAQYTKGTKISIFWTLPENPSVEITKLILYRTPQQISSYKQLQAFTPVAELAAQDTGYTDTVKDYKDYFYTVISYTTKAYPLVMLSVNSTVTGTHLAPAKKQAANKVQEPEKTYAEGELREMPLPTIDVVEGVNKESPISDETVKIAMTLARPRAETKELLDQYIFEQDLISPDAGDDYLLFDILKNYFVQRKYSDAITRLERLTATNINEETRNRSYFYLGEAQYLMGNYKASIKTFARVEKAYPELSKKWINSALDQL